MPEDNQPNTSPDLQYPVTNTVENLAPTTEQTVQPASDTPKSAAPAPTAITGDTAPFKPAAAPATIYSKNAPASKGKKKVNKLAVLAAGVVLLIGGSASAYYGVIAPNQPENVLKTAISNTAQQRKVDYDGKFTYESTEKKSELKAVNITFNGQYDADQSDFSSVYNITASGATLPLEIRGVGNSLYFKVGDLSSIKGLVQAGAPAYASAIDGINKTIANQWIEVDETLLKQANANCALDTSFALTKTDIELLQKRYKEVPFANVKNNSNDNVNGRAAIKYEIDLDDNKLAEYSKQLQELSIVKKMKECNPNKDESADLDSLADDDITPITLWVDKSSKQIVKLAGKSTKQDEKKSQFKADFEVTLKYGQASIAKPDGSKPFMEVFGGLSEVLGPLLSGGLNGDQNTQYSSDLSELQGVSPECLTALQAYGNSNGTTPIPPNCL